jgi:hypothetical protein
VDIVRHFIHLSNVLWHRQHAPKCSRRILHVLRHRHLYWSMCDTSCAYNQRSLVVALPWMRASCVISPTCSMCSDTASTYQNLRVEHSRSCDFVACVGVICATSCVYYQRSLVVALPGMRASCVIKITLYNVLWHRQHIPKCSRRALDILQPRHSRCESYVPRVVPTTSIPW